jgi:fucose 4-O-acetylase-like acetyltransferase
METQPGQRYHSLDALRAAMMLLGLVLHSAASYTHTPLQLAWPYNDAQTSIAFDLLLFFIHLFRMPTFFVVAGFFAALLYDRDGGSGFARNRARRVLLPLVLFWPLMPLSGLGFIFAIRQAGGHMPWIDPNAQPLLHQPVLGHLWFLYDLLLFYGAAMAVLPLAARLPEGWRQRVGAAIGSMPAKPWGIIVLSAVTTMTLIPMEVPGIEAFAGLLPPLRVIAAYGVFFAVGWALHGQRQAIASLGGRWKIPLGAGLLTATAYLFVIVRRPIADPKLWHLASVGLASLSIWLLIVGIVGVFVRYVAKPRPLVRYFSDASYWMYLVHIAPTIWLPGLLARSGAPAFVKFTTVLATTIFLSAVTYHYLVRSTLVGQLLSGRRYPRTLPVLLPSTDGRPETVV